MSTPSFTTSFGFTDSKWGLWLKRLNPQASSSVINNKEERYGDNVNTWLWKIISMTVLFGGVGGGVWGFGGVIREN